MAEKIDIVKITKEHAFFSSLLTLNSCIPVICATSAWLAPPMDSIHSASRSRLLSSIEYTESRNRRAAACFRERLRPGALECI
jgi:hypothetical protein